MARYSEMIEHYIDHLEDGVKSTNRSLEWRSSKAPFRLLQELFEVCSSLTSFPSATTA